MGFRVVDKSSYTFTFETDIPPASRSIHPSGVLHAFRSTSRPAAREEVAFAWVANCLNIESALRHLEKQGFERCQGIVFIPYSTKDNWSARYPQAEFALECSESGRCRVLSGGRRSAEEGEGDGDGDDSLAARKRMYDYNARAVNNMFQDKACIPNRERDELHIEIYKYLSWLHARVVESQQKPESVEPTQEEEGAASEDDGDDGGDEDPAGAVAAARRKNLRRYGLDVSELLGALDKLESAFLVIPSAKLEAAAAAAAEGKNDKSPQQQQGDQQQGGEAGEESPLRQDSLPSKAPAKSSLLPGGQGASGDGGLDDGGPRGLSPCWLEKELSAVLRRMTEARERGGKATRRSRKRPQPIGEDGVRLPQPGRTRVNAPAADFDYMFQKLVQYKEEHGDCQVPRSRNAQSDDLRQLALWVHRIRYKQSMLAQQGITHEEVLPGKKLSSKMLTAERLARLNSIGFVWSVMSPKVPWEERFREVTEYYEQHGQWPSQSMGQLGEWVHKQRTFYAKNDVNYMMTKAPKLDEVGFEWTPRGNTRLVWETGLQMLLEFGKIHGHYDVPRPVVTSEGSGYNSPEYRLYKWVESLHSMYRSYKLGRQSGSLTDERVLLLVKHGFVFRND